MAVMKPRVVPPVQLAKIVLIPIIMFGFGFALIPLYDIFCDITGLNGKTGRIELSSIDHQADLSRTIEVRFLANTGNGLTWSFEPGVKKMLIHPGKLYEAVYRVRNTNDHDTIGQAIPSVSPGLAAQHFNKTECFCFSQQILAAHESKDMPIRFIVSKDIDSKIEQITLSYTFFNVENPESGV